MARDQFRIVYDGPAVEDGEMDIAKLAGSLLALGKLIERAHAIRTGSDGGVKVMVRSDIQRGSFDVGIAVQWLDVAMTTILDWASTKEGDSAISLLGLLGISVTGVACSGGKGLLQVVRWLKGRSVKRQIHLKEGNTTLIADDGEQLDVDSLVARLVEEPTIRQSLERFTEPLREDGLVEIRFEETPGSVSERILADEAEIFSTHVGTEPTSSSHFKATYQIKRLYFDRGRKWRLSNGLQTIYAEIQDDTFWAKVEGSQVSFAKGDYLVCRVRMDQWLTAAGLRTEFTILEVEHHIRHTPPGTQHILPGLDGTDR